MILCTCMQHAANTQHNTQHAGGVVEHYNIIKHIHNINITQKQKQKQKQQQHEEGGCVVEDR